MLTAVRAVFTYAAEKLDHYYWYNTGSDLSYETLSSRKFCDTHGFSQNNNILISSYPAADAAAQKAVYMPRSLLAAVWAEEAFSKCSAVGDQQATELKVCDDYYM